MEIARAAYCCYGYPGRRSGEKNTKIITGAVFFQKNHLCTLFSPKECLLAPEVYELLPKLYLLVSFEME